MADKYTQRVVNLWASPNPWGYRFNINHPTVNRLYKEYQQQHGLDVRISMTDAQRHAFEEELLQRMRKRALTTQERDAQKVIDDLND